MQQQGSKKFPHRPGGPLQFNLQNVSSDRNLWLPRIVKIVYDPDGNASVAVKHHQTVSIKEVKFLDDRCESSMGSQSCHAERHEVLCCFTRTAHATIMNSVC